MRQFVTVDIQNRVGTLTLDNPPVNALSAETLAALDAAFEGLLRDPDVRAIVITGAGEKAFVAGANIKAFEAQINGGEAGESLSKQHPRV